MIFNILDVAMYGLQRPTSPYALAITLALHAGVIVLLLLQYEPVRSVITQAAPIMVSLITPLKAVEKPQELPKSRPVKPKIVERPKAVEAPLITAASEAPAPYVVAPQPEPKPLPPIEASPPRPAAAAPAPIVLPRFDADYLDNPPPVYPTLSRRLGERGKVILRVLVNAKGTADKVELKSSSGSNRLDNAAFEAVRRWRFVPARQGDQSVAAWVLIPITFTLEG